MANWDMGMIGDYLDWARLRRTYPDFAEEIDG